MFSVAYRSQSFAKGGKLAQAMRPAPLGWSFSLFHKISMKKTWLPFAFFQRKSLEVRESKGVLAVTAVLTSARPAIRSIQSLLLEQGDSGSFPEAPEQRGSLTSTNQYKPLFLMCLRCGSHIHLPAGQKPRWSEVLSVCWPRRSCSAEDHAGGHLPCVAPNDAAAEELPSPPQK